MIVFLRTNRGYLRQLNYENWWFLKFLGELLYVTPFYWLVLVPLFVGYVLMTFFTPMTWALLPLTAIAMHLPIEVGEETGQLITMGLVVFSLLFAWGLWKYGRKRYPQLPIWLMLINMMLMHVKGSVLFMQHTYVEGGHDLVVTVGFLAVLLIISALIHRTVLLMFKNFLRV